jgi:hypothetical protein
VPLDEYLAALRALALFSASYCGVAAREGSAQA